LSDRPADVLVVGGGLIGCGIAAELAARGRSVLLLERGEPGTEASAAAAGMVSHQVEAREPGPFFDLVCESRALYPDWVAQIVAETGIDVGYRETGRLVCDPEGDAAEDPLGPYQWQRAAGRRVDRLAREDLPAELEARLAPSIRSALFFPDEAVVEPRPLVRAVERLAERRGARILRGTPVRRFLVVGGRCAGVETSGGRIAAGAVVDAAGAWAAFDAGLSIPLPVRPIRGQILALRLPGEPLPTVLSSHHVYAVPRPNGVVLLGSTMEDVGFRKAVTAEALARLVTAAARVVPSLESAEFVSAWSGLRPATPDGLPVLGESPLPGLFFATGHFRSGILLAPATAKILADRLTGRAGRDLSSFSVDRFASSARPA
jgi:glycine oxidase